MGRPRKHPEPPEIVWEAPPERTLPSMYDGILDEIKARPGTWARLRLMASQSGAYSATQSLRKRMTDPAWEFRSATTEAGHGVYARYRTAEQLKAAAREPKR